jgi:phosphopentomutase
LLTGDHGCDPTTPPTDHSRERTPLLAAGLRGGPVDLGTRGSFSDLGLTVADLLGAEAAGLEGESFVDLLGIEGSS